MLDRGADAVQRCFPIGQSGAYTGTADRARARASLTADDFATLMTFTRRCVLAALRNEDPGAAEAAFDALSAIDLARVGWRDVLTAASLASYAARRVGLEAHEVLARAVRWAEPRVSQIIEHAVTSEINLTGDAGYHEVNEGMPSSPSTFPSHPSRLASMIGASRLARISNSRIRPQSAHRTQTCS